MANNTNTSKEKVKKENKVAKGTKEIVSELKKLPGQVLERFANKH